MVEITKLVQTTIRVGGKRKQLCDNCVYVDREDAFCTRYQKALNEDEEFPRMPFIRCTECRKEFGNDGR